MFLKITDQTDLQQESHVVGPHCALCDCHICEGAECRWTIKAMMADPLRHISNPKIILQTSFFIFESLHLDILSLRSQNHY